MAKSLNESKDHQANFQTILNHEITASSPIVGINRASFMARSMVLETDVRIFH